MTASTCIIWSRSLSPCLRLPSTFPANSAWSWVSACRACFESIVPNGLVVVLFNQTSDFGQIARAPITGEADQSFQIAVCED
jgi:hypothetical protein